MKRMISIALIITTTILGMKEESPSWSITSFLNEHDWHERKGNLTIEQRKKFAECVDYRKKEFKGHLTERDLAVILIDSLDEAEESKIPKKFATHTQAYQWLYRAIINNSPQEIKKVFRGVKVLYSSFPNSSINDFLNAPNCKSKLPLVWAISLACSKAVKTLLELNANPNTNYHGYSVIAGGECFFRLSHYALLLGDSKSALELIKAGADFSGGLQRGGTANNDEGRNHPTAIGYAIGLFNQDPETCSELIQEMFNRGYNEQKFDPQANERNTNVWALALTASQYGLSEDEEISKSLVDLFIKNGCDINKPVFFDQVYLTPLAIALQVKNIHNIALLLEAKADPSKWFVIPRGCTRRTTNGFITPVEYTQEMVLKKYPEGQGILELLTKYIKKQFQEKVEINDRCQHILKKNDFDKEN